MLIGGGTTGGTSEANCGTEESFTQAGIPGAQTIVSPFTTPCWMYDDS